MATHDINPSPNTANTDAAFPRAPEANHQAEAVEAQGEGFEVVDEDFKEFFAPVSSDVIDGLLGQYQAYRARVLHLAEVISADSSAVHYFLAGNVDTDRRYSTPAVDKLFDPKGAIAALNSVYWSKVLGLTDVYDCMPQARRDEWDKAVREQTTPDFEEKTVRPTLDGLLASRQKFFAERVDGIFRGLSGEHVTNAPEGFGRRMILSYVWSSGPFASLNHPKAGLINDLRCVIAKFMGRDEPKHYASDALLEAFRRDTGAWHAIDGGALRIRVYLKGTAHLEVNPDMAWRLNSILASLYPSAIPSQFRKRPAKRLKDFALIGRPLPFAVLALLPTSRHRRRDELRISKYGVEAPLYAEAVRVVEAIGGTVDQHGDCRFDYDPTDVLVEIAVTGCIPDRVAHQFYPTPEKLARIAVDLAEIDDTHLVLEPSAGQGGLAAYLPKERTTCVEVASLHCAILKARGFTTIEADFIEWAVQIERTAQRFDRIVMNPPFSEGRAEAHTRAASSLVAGGGRLVAILPASMRGQLQLQGFDLHWSGIFEREFAGTSANVAILTAQRVAL